MDFFEAMQHLKEGKPVRIVSWSKDKYFGLCEESLKICGKNKTKFSIVDQNSIEISPSISFSLLLRDEWEIYEDSKVS